MRLAPALLLAPLAFALGCDSDANFETPAPAGPSVTTGQTAAFGGSDARSWVRVDTDGTPMAVGVTFGGDALDRLMADGDMGMFELPLDFPDVAGLPFDHVTLDWNPDGHEPEGLFDSPHVDVHFYLLTPAERDQLVPTSPDWEANLVMMPPESMRPAGYEPTPGGVPRMGAHWIDTADPTFAPGGVFSEVMIYGFYAGEMGFIEPMLTADFVRSREPVDEALALPAEYPEAGFYPTRYTAAYDAATGDYTVALEGLVRR